MTNTHAPVVRMTGVTRVYRQGAIDVHALRGVDLTIQPGEFSVICGPSGSGKTTLLNLIGALDRPTSGEIQLEGESLKQLSRRELSRLRRDRIGFVFQSYNLIPVLTAYENAESVLALQGVPEAERKRRIEELMDEVGMTGLMDRRPDQLSGGQQQRVAIVRAIAANPALVLADEPTANLDSETAGRLMSVMEELNQQHAITFLFSTHDPRVMDRARRVIRLVDGRIAEDIRR